MNDEWDTDYPRTPGVLSGTVRERTPGEESTTTIKDREQDPPSDLVKKSGQKIKCLREKSSQIRTDGLMKTSQTKLPT